MRALAAVASTSALAFVLTGCDVKWDSPGSSEQKVNVEFYGEAGCPFCQGFALGPLRKALDTDGIADIMNFSYTPFGQALFNTPECGEMDTKSYVWGAFWPGYNANARLCYDVACGSLHDELYGNRPQSCFDRAKGPYCQHGGAECAVNAIQACARNISNNNWTRYVPFAVCVEDLYSDIQVPPGATANSTIEENKTLADPSINDTIQNCVHGTELSAKDVLSCYHESEFEMLAEMARNTVPHVGVPFVRIMACSGEWTVLEIDGRTPPENLLLDAVCRATCSGSTAEAQCSQLNLTQALEISI